MKLIFKNKWGSVFICLFVWVYFSIFWVFSWKKMSQLGCWEIDSMMALCIPCSMVIKESAWDQHLTKMGEKLGLSKEGVELWSDPRQFWLTLWKGRVALHCCSYLGYIGQTTVISKNVIRCEPSGERVPSWGYSLLQLRWL